MIKHSITDFEYVNSILAESYHSHRTPSVTLIANTKKTPFHVLVSTMISARTKDQVTLEASKRIFALANSAGALAKLSIKQIEDAIYPAGFYKTKAVRIHDTSQIILEKFNGKIPSTIEELVKLPGVGRKTANLVIILGFNKDGICVDTHVHRISNRFGWVKTNSPEQTEFALREFLPLEYWRTINDYLVSYGQMVCRPISPICSKCKLVNICPKLNVVKSR